MAQYLRIQMRRSRHRTSAVRRYLLLILAGTTAVVLLGYLFIRLHSAGAGLTESVTYTWLFLLTAVTAVLVLVALRLIATTVGDLLRVLAATPAKRPQRLMDEALAASAIGDHEIVVGILSIFVPRLTRISLGGGILFWLWLTVLPLLDAGFHSAGFARALYTAPLTIGGITLSGVLGACVLALWLLCLGRGSSGLYGAGTAGLVISVGHFLYIPLVLGLVVYVQLSGYMESHSPHSFTWLLYRLLAIALFVAGYELLLTDAVRHRRASTLIAVFSPLLLPLAVALILAYLSLTQYYDRSLRVLPLEISQAWAGMMLFNPLAIASRACLWRDIAGYIDSLELNYLLLITQQILLVVIGAHKARQAVARWRQRPA